MDYYVNEYSLRGQFKDTNDFFESLRTYTLPVFKNIKNEKGSIIWKKDTLWNCEVCPEKTLYDMQPSRRERSAELTKLKIFLRELYCSEPLWSDEQSDTEENVKYHFDEEYRDNFTHKNCFTEAWKHEGRIISFLHPEYKEYILPISVIHQEKEKIIELDNIYNIEWWKNCPITKKWPICGKYIAEIRGKEFDYHPPHFHVLSPDYDAVFHLKTGDFYVGSKESIPPNLIHEVKEWYSTHKNELEAAWNSLHQPITYN